MITGAITAAPPLWAEALGLNLVVRSVSSLSTPGSLMLQATPTRIPPRSSHPRPGLLGPFRMPVSQPWLPVPVALIRKSFSLFLFREYRARENKEAFQLLPKRTPPFAPILPPTILFLLSSPFEAWEG